MGVRAWMSGVESGKIFLSVLVIGEIRQGIESIRRRDAPSATRLEGWLTRIKAGYRERILPVSPEIAELWGRLNSSRLFPAVDGLLAATALIHELILVTSNVSDIELSGVEYLNPFL